MKRNTLALLVSLFLTQCLVTPLSAQEASKPSEQAQVQKVIEQLFEAMRTSDTTLLRKVFHEEARLQTALTNPQTQATKLIEGNINDFVRQIGTPHEQVYDERILSYEIKVDEAMAIAWTPYLFYVGDTFSHCGVNAFQLFKTAEGWKITQVIDTRRKEPCQH